MGNGHRMLTTAVLLLVAISGGALADDDITIGRSTTVYSEVLGEEREVLIYLPEGYESSTESYPVLYLLDGDRHFHHVTASVEFLSRNGRIPRTIVVAIPNTDRLRDFSPVKIPGISSGGADSFLAFLRNELVPHIDSEYRTQPFRILCGHSLAGMFTIYTLITHPDDFGAYVAMSPHLIHNQGIVVRITEKKIDNWAASNKFLYYTLGDEPLYTQTLEYFTRIMENKRPEGLKWRFVTLDQENNGTVSLKTVYQGLEMIYDEWNPPANLATRGLEGLKAHYVKLSSTYGYDIPVPETVANLFGYALLSAQENEGAIEVFMFNLESYPESANVYDSLGEAYEADGQLTLALSHYARACRMGEENSDQNLRFYVMHRDELKKKIAAAN